MKTTLKLYMAAAVAFAISALIHCTGAEPAKAPPAPAKEQANFLDRVDFQAVGVFKSQSFESPHYGAGVSAGVQLNKYVTLGLSLISYEDGNWGGSAIDETPLSIRADLLKSDNGKLRLFGIGSGVRDWANDDWGFGVGLGVRLDLTKNFYLESSAQVRAFIHQDKDLYVPFGIGYRF